VADDAFVGEVTDGVGRLWYHDGAGARQEVPHVVRDSPGGLSWGFAGKGPSDAALSILAAEVGDVARAEPYRQAFTDEVVAKLPINGRFALSRDQVRSWLASKGYEQSQVLQRLRAPAAAGTDEAPAQPEDLDRKAVQLAARARALDERERRVTEREARVDALALAVGLVPEVAQATWLPAEPVRRQLEALVVDTGDPIAEVAAVYHLEPGWAEAVVDGRVSRVDLAQVRQVCEGLRCTPYDMWGTAGARSVAHAYGPAEWPAHTEALVPVEGVDVGPALAVPEPGPPVVAVPPAPEPLPAPELTRELVPEMAP
jgi:hypothetical protein